MILKCNATLKPKSLSLTELAGKPVHLMDADALSDDLLATAVVQPDGTAEFIFDLADAGSGDSPLEASPDLYLIIRGDHGQEIFRSVTLGNADFLQTDPVSHDRQTTLNLDFPELEKSGNP